MSDAERVERRAARVLRSSAAVTDSNVKARRCCMTRWPITERDAREMYSTGRGNETARRYARLWTRVFSAGLVPRRWVVREVPGRRSGRTASFPLGMTDVNGRWYLVSMLGECNWVANVRAAEGHVVLRRRRRRAVRLVEVPVTDRAAILRRYVDKVPGARPHIPVPIGSPMAEFGAVARGFPVFEVVKPG